MLRNEYNPTPHSSVRRPTMPSPNPKSWLFPLMLAAGVAAAPLVSCERTTAGKEVAFRASVQGSTSGSTPADAAFTTYAGWNVTLSQAVTVMGPLYFYEGAPQASLLHRFFSIPTAHACPTHAQYNKGAVLGEVVQQYAVDLLGEPTDLGEVFGIAGTCRTVEVHLHPPGEVPMGPSPTDVDVLGGQTIRIEGQAEKGGVEVPFVAALSIPDEGLMRVVESIAAEVVLDDASGVGTLVVEPLLDMWFATVEFDSLTEQDGERYVFSDGTQAWNALLRGVRSRQSYRVSWRMP